MNVDNQTRDISIQDDTARYIAERRKYDFTSFFLNRKIGNTYALVPVSGLTRKKL